MFRTIPPEGHPVKRKNAIYLQGWGGVGIVPAMVTMHKKTACRNASGLLDPAYLATGLNEWNLSVRAATSRTLRSFQAARTSMLRSSLLRRTSASGSSMLVTSSLTRLAVAAAVAAASCLDLSASTNSRRTSTFTVLVFMLSNNRPCPGLPIAWFLGSGWLGCNRNEEETRLCRERFKQLSAQFCISILWPLAASQGRFGGWSAMLTLFDYQNVLVSRFCSIAGHMDLRDQRQDATFQKTKNPPAFDRGACAGCFSW